MTKKNNTYWQERFELLEEALHKDIMKLMPEIDKAFTQAQMQVESDIQRWVQRFADNNNVSMVEARKMLNARELAELKWTVEEYIKRARENVIDQRWVKELENASARAHISRLEAIKLQIQNTIEFIYGNYFDVVDQAVWDTYTEGYYQSMFEVAKGTGVTTTFAGIDDVMVAKIISKPWAADGRNFSDRIWVDRVKLVNELHNELTRMCVTGENPQKTIKRIAEKFGVSKNNAARLIHTEAAFAASAARRDSFRELGIKQYEICATLDNRTSPICQEMDGKVFDEKDRQIGVTAPPFHPRCRTTDVPVVDEGWNVGASRIARGADGKTYYVPADMKYKEWKEKYIQDATPEPKHDDAKDREQMEKYKAIFGSKVPSSLSKFQNLKYNNITKWEHFKTEKQDKLNQMDFEQMSGLIGKLGKIIEISTFTPHMAHYRHIFRAANTIHFL